MRGKSSIEWTDATWNPLRVRLKSPVERAATKDAPLKILPYGTWGYHCERVSPGCTNCYAEAMNGRTLPAWGTGLDYTRQSRDKVDIYLDEEELLKPLRWKKPRMVFVCSMTDLFAEFVPDEFIVKMFTVMESAYWHTFQVLTKRSERMCLMLSHPHFPSYVRKFGYDWLGPKQYNERGPHWRQNQWLGVSVEDQQRYRERVAQVRETPAAVRWLSIEPLLEALGEIDLKGIDWVVLGGESGRGARFMRAAWVRSVRDQCANSGVPFFFKQWGEYLPDSQNPAMTASGRGDTGGIRYGKKRAGRLLDGREWNEMPAAAGARA